MWRSDCSPYSLTSSAHPQAGAFSDSLWAVQKDSDDHEYKCLRSVRNVPGQPSEREDVWVIGGNKRFKDTRMFWPLKWTESADHLVGVHFSLILSFWLCSILHRGIYIGHRNEGFLVRHRCSDELFTTFCLFRLCLSQPMCGQRGNERKCSTMSNLFFFPGCRTQSTVFFFCWLKLFMIKVSLQKTLTFQSCVSRGDVSLK